jgi:hypothetical protein
LQLASSAMDRHAGASSMMEMDRRLEPDQAT